MERKKRHARSRVAAQAPFIITDDDKDIFRLLARYRYLRSSYIYALLPHRSQQGLGRRLRKLYDFGFLNKPREQRRGYNDLYCPDVYELDEKGERVLGEDTKEITRLYRQRTDSPVKNFAHSMMICDAMASIEIGLQDTDHELISWQEIVARTDHPEPMKLPCSIRYTFKNGATDRNDTFIIPDGLFGIKRPDGKVSFFALEAEHYNPIEPTNLKRASFLKKLLAYRNIAETGVYKDQLTIPNMRVLIVAPTEKRIEHMMELTERITNGSNLFLFTHIPIQEELLRAPKPYTSLATRQWARAGHEPATLV